MKIIIALLAITLTVNANSQLLGVEFYQPSLERNFDSDKQYVIGDDSYEFVLMDAVNNEISMFLFEAVYDEFMRVFTDNGLDIPLGTVITSDMIDISSEKQIVKAIQSSGDPIMIRYELIDGYYAYLNIQDEFCAVSFTTMYVE